VRRKEGNLEARSSARARPAASLPQPGGMDDSLFLLFFLRRTPPLPPWCAEAPLAYLACGTSATKTPDGVRVEPQHRERHRPPLVGSDLLAQGFPQPLSSYSSFGFGHVETRGGEHGRGS